MNELGKEYGTALYMLACEENKVSVFSEALSKVKQVFDDEPDYIEFISSPAISLNDRLSAIEGAFSAVLPETVVSFLQLMCEKGRLTVFHDAVEEFNALYSYSQRIVKVKVTSAIELSDNEKTRLKDKLETVYKFNVETEFFVDESILGGIIVDFDGKILDGSVRQRLREVKDVIST